MRTYMVALGLLFIALGHPSFAQKAVEVRVAAGAPLSVECALRVEQRAEWRRDGAPPPADMRPGAEAPRAGRVTARLTAPAARAAHAGLYTCSAEPGAARVRVLVLPAADTSATLAPAPAPAAAPSDAADEPTLVKFELLKGTITLNCSAHGEENVGIAYTWKKNNTALEEVEALKGRYKLEAQGGTFQLTARAVEDDYGNYTCLANGETAREWRVHARPLARLPPNSNVVEGQKLKLTCKLVGKPPARVAWTYSAAEGANATDVALSHGARAQLSDSAAGVPDGELVLAAAERGDAGVYTCTPEDGHAAATVLRVKDMYAALWPFLGICAEVLVLCAIILVYEKRRTKPETEDSDTDNHEQ